MHRVLSFQMGTGGTRGFGESSEFVTKRMCFSFIFFIAFLALLGGFLLGRFATERTEKLRKDRERLNELETKVLEVPENVGKSEQLFLKELDEIFDEKFRATETIISERMKEDGDDNTRRENVRIILHNDYHLFDKIVDQKSSIVATIHGTHEPDRWIVLSVSGDGIKPALELAEIFSKLKTTRNWKPRRTMVFRFFDEPRYSCCDGLPKYLKSRIIACLIVHKNAIQRNGCFVASGSDVVKSSVLEALSTVQESIFGDKYDDRRVLRSCPNPQETETLQNNALRLPLDVPHASVAFLSTVGNTTTSVETETTFQAKQAYSRTLIRIIGLTMWRYSESQTLHWESKYFEERVKKFLEMINAPQFVEIKGNISTAVKELIIEARSLKKEENTIGKSNSLSSRIKNDLVVELERALLCPDASLWSKTDLASFPSLLSKPPVTSMDYLKNVLKCYEDALEVLKEG